jgi:hypothetical protein
MLGPSRRLSCGLSLAAAAAVAQTPGTPRPEVRITRTTLPLKIDGHLDDPAWTTTEAIRRFVQIDPDEGQPASEDMEVRLLLGPDALYVGARMSDRRIATAQHRLGRRDDPQPADAFAIELDPSYDRIHGVRFEVSSGGTISDAIVAATGTRDASWDPVWEVRTSVDSRGWTAELRIPLSQLHFARASDVWGVQIERFLLRRLERTYFAPTPKQLLPGGAMSPAYYGMLSGMADLPATRGLEVLPYVSASASYVHDADAGPVLRRPSGEYSRRAGADIKAGLSSDFTLNATVNPDFGQVEVDPAVVNLSAFETIFPEKRPFFVESADRFAFGRMRDWYDAASPTLFYSRRIGRAPHLSGFQGSDVAFADSPGQTDILSALKLVGRTADGWTVGALDAVTNREDARTLTASGAPGAAAVEPLTNYFVGRATRDLRAGATTIGGSLTAVDRRLDEAVYRDALTRSAYVGGVDLNHSWAQHAWALDANVAGSRLAGSAAALALTQRSSARYFQRPDGTNAHFDPARTSLLGYDQQVALTRLSGNWVGSVALQDVSPGFESNDLGLLRDAGRRSVSLDLHYQDFTPGTRFRHFIVWPFTQHQWNYDGQLVGNKFNLYLFGELLSHWRVGAEYDYYTATFDDRLTRGGPVARAPASHLYYYRVDSPARNRTSVFSTSHLTWTEAGGRILTVQSGVVYQAHSNLKFEIDPTFGVTRDPAQFLGAYDDPTATATYGRRTVFARLDQRSLGLEARTDWVVSPRLTLQAYAQELVVGSPFTDVKYLRRGGSYEFSYYGVNGAAISTAPDGRITVDADGTGPAPAFTLPRPDFTLRSTRLNAVLRWEFLPGSSLFAVWQHQRGRTTSVGALTVDRALDGLLAGPSDNVIALKIAYWMAR